jgi:tetratricopeptide (TPR) repeat protein
MEVNRAGPTKVTDFDPDSLDPSPDEQFNGNHFTLGISVFGFKKALEIILWPKYTRNLDNFMVSDGKCWNNGQHNGYDLCQHIKCYMFKIGKPNLSLVEAILCGEVEELECLRSEVGVADGFFSHVQAVMLTATLKSLEDAASRYEKELGENPRFFIDYCCVRQCVKNDFATDRLTMAIKTIGITIFELGTDFLSDNALLKRSFCVLELFATVKAKGLLLVCGPLLGDAAMAVKLAAIAADSEQCKEVMDSSAATTRSAQAEIEIKAYIQRTVGFERTDKAVLAAIVNSCVISTEGAFAEAVDCGASVLHSAGRMLFDVGDYAAAIKSLMQALTKQRTAFGEEAFETAETVYMIGQCHNYMESSEAMQWYMLSLRLDQAHSGSDHVATARSLVGIGNTHRMACEYTKSIEYCNLAIVRIKHAKCAANYIDVHADALQVIGAIHNARVQKHEGLDCSMRSVQVRESKHGPDHASVANALAGMATAYGQLGNRKMEMQINLRVLAIHEKVKGPLSWEAGLTRNNVAVIHYNAGRYAEAAVWWKQAVDAMEYTMGPNHREAKEYRGYLKQAVDRIDPESGCWFRWCIVCVCCCVPCVSSAACYFSQVKLAAHGLPSCCCPCLASSRSKSFAEIQEYRWFLQAESAESTGTGSGVHPIDTSVMRSHSSAVR